MNPKIKENMLLFYKALFILFIFFLSWLYSTAIFFQVAVSFDVDVYGKFGYPDHFLLNISTNFALAFLISILSWLSFGKYKFFRILSPFIVLSLAFFINEISSWQLKNLAAILESPKRLESLKRRHGDKVDPCLILNIGDPYKKAVKVYSSEIFPGKKIDGPHENEGEKLRRDRFTIRESLTQFTVGYDPDSLEIREIECADGSWEKVKKVQ